MKVLYSSTWIEYEDQGIYSIRSLYKTQTFTIYLLLKVFLNVLYWAKWLQARSFSSQCPKASHSTTTNRDPSIFFFFFLMQSLNWNSSQYLFYLLLKLQKHELFPFLSHYVQWVHVIGWKKSSTSQVLLTI